LREYGSIVSVMSAYAMLAVVWVMIFLVFLGHMLPRLRDILRHAPLADTPPCDGIQCDFSVFWPAGLLARQGQFETLYDPMAFDAFRKAILIPTEQRLDWIYPPPSLLPLMPVSHLPLGIAFLVWTSVLAVLAVGALRLACVSWPVIAVGLLSPAALWDIEMGQWEVFCGSILVAGLLLQAWRPGIGGLLLSLMLFKPQTAWAMPAALLAAGRWRVVAGGILGAGALCALTTLCLGPEAWRVWMTGGMKNAHEILIQGHSIGLEESVSVFWAMRNGGASVHAAYVAQILAALSALAVVAHAWRDQRFCAEQRVALTIVGGVLVTPYLFIVDLVAYEISLALLAERRGWKINPVDAFFWLWPMLSPALYIWKGWLLTPVVMAVLLLRLWAPAMLLTRCSHTHEKLWLR
jgi:hypothetical protein